MTRVFDHLLAERIIPPSSAPAFERYLADPVFSDQVERSLLMQDRISLATLTEAVPNGMNDRAMRSMLYDLRHRFRTALEALREIAGETAARNGPGEGA